VNVNRQDTEMSKRQLVAKSIFKKEYADYQKWTEVSPFLACGLQGVIVKEKLNLRNNKPKQRRWG